MRIGGWAKGKTAPFVPSPFAHSLCIPPPCFFLPARIPRTKAFFHLPILTHLARSLTLVPRKHHPPNPPPHRNPPRTLSPYPPSVTRSPLLLPPPTQTRSRYLCLTPSSHTPIGHNPISSREGKNFFRGRRCMYNELRYVRVRRCFMGGFS